ncbi:MAG: hypothetical protein K6F69_05175 [Treponema sp.]|nr:hypothetical protein [Treponema sp.]
MLLSIIIIAVVDKGFLTARNIRNIIMIASPLAILGCGFSLCLINGIPDFSFSSVAGFAGVVAASFAQNGDVFGRMYQTSDGFPLWIILLIILGISVIFGAVSTFLLVYCRLPSYLNGLVIGSIASGVTSYYLSLPEGGSRVLSTFTPGFTALGASFIGKDLFHSVPTMFVILIVIAILIFVFLNYLPAGHYYNGIQNLKACNRTCLFIKLFAVYAIAMLLYSLAGCIESSRENCVTAGFYDFSMFPVITGVIVGSVSVFGGKGNVFNAIIGIFIVEALLYALDFVGVPAGLQIIVQAALIGIAIFLDFCSSKTYTSRYATPFPLEQEKNPAL